MATGYKLAPCLADLEKEAENCTVEGPDGDLMTLIPSAVKASLAEVKIESEARDVVEWVYCREGEEEVGEEPKVQQRKPGVKTVWAVWTAWAGSKKIDSLPRTGAVVWMGETVVDKKAGKEKGETPVLEVMVAPLPIRGARWVK